MDSYIFKDGLLKIEDPELEIHYQGTFNPLLIPENPTPKNFPSGHKLFIKHCVDGCYEAFFKKEGILDGEWKLFYPDGQPKLSSFYLNGELHGPSCFFDEAKKTLTESWFLFGEKQGKTKWFYEDGSKNSLQRFKNNEWHGLQEFWYKSGNLKTVMNYHLGTLHGEAILYYPSGTIKRQLLFDKGKPLTTD